MGDTLLLNFPARLTNYKFFQKNDSTVAKESDKFNPMRPYEPLRVRVGHTPVIAGWTEGLQLLNKGAKAKFIIPSSLGYGEKQQQNEIPPYAPLVFDVEVIDIIAGPTEEPDAEPAPNAPVIN